MSTLADTLVANSTSSLFTNKANFPAIKINRTIGIIQKKDWKIK